MLKCRTIMILGCTSDAGKSLLTASLCRYFANKGIRVAPFKAQNMSNNAAVTLSGGEIGRAQYLQAMAARVVPETRMNPILLKPSSNTFSQVIVNGKVSNEISSMSWIERKNTLWPLVTEALDSLRNEFDMVIIEGAGSPAEINLRAGDIVNMSVALHSNAECYLVADIDRGGAFAHLLGTYQCLSSEEQKLVKGFVLNKFRGDPALLGNAYEWLESKTGVKTVALVPYVKHALPEEDAFFHKNSGDGNQKNVNIALVLYPWASNLEEFDPLFHEVGAKVVPIKSLSDLTEYDAIILPGSKSTAKSLEYLRESGLANALQKAAIAGKVIYGVCGGMQILGKSISDPHSIENGGEADGFGLLPVETILQKEKQVAQRTVRWIHGGDVSGYEIHAGITTVTGACQPILSDSLGWQNGNVYGVYLHGLFNNTAYRQYFLEMLGWQGSTFDWNAKIESELEKIAELVSVSGWDKHL